MGSEVRIETRLRENEFGADYVCSNNNLENRYAFIPFRRSFLFW